MKPNMIGAYGPWAAKIVGEKPGALSLRSGRFKNISAWRRKARARVWDLLAPPELKRIPKARVEEKGIHDGLYFEKLSWQLPWGPRTEALFLKPANAGKKTRLPAILGLHDHGGKKYLGLKKIALATDQIHPYVQEHHDDYYGGRAWANELARRGYAVLIHDTFPFASRRVHVADASEQVKWKGVDPGPDEKTDDIIAYNAWAGEHEHIMAKSLFCAGTTWPGVYVVEDQAALSILCSRKDVDASRVGCGGLSGGGMRTTYLAGLDDRIRCCFVAGFFTTWRDFLLDKVFTHTWMIYTPLLPRDMDFPEILALRAPKPALVLNTTEDALFTLSEVKRAGRIAAEVYERVGAPRSFRLSHYPGPHKLDVPMQQEAFEWLDRWLKE